MFSFTCPRCGRSDQVKRVRDLYERGFSEETYTEVVLPPWDKRNEWPPLEIPRTRTVQSAESVKFSPPINPIDKYYRPISSLVPFMNAIHKRMAEKKAAPEMPRYYRASKKWLNLYYCRGCDVVFVPGETRYVSSYSMRDFLTEIPKAKLIDDPETLAFIREPNRAGMTLLIHRGPEVVRPILHSLVTHLQELGAAVSSENQRRKLTSGLQWLDFVHVPVLVPVSAIIASLGDSGIQKLCNNVAEPSDYRIQKAAALVLYLFYNPVAPMDTELKDHSRDYVVRAIDAVMQEAEVYDFSTEMLLTGILAAAGDEVAERQMDDIRREGQLSDREVFVKNFNTAVLELLGWKEPRYL